MLKRALLALSVLLVLGTVAHADQAMVGVTLDANAGEPDFKENRPTLFAAYEAQSTWRFSFTSSEYEHKDLPLKLDVEILGFERMFVYEMGRNLLLIGAFGPGLFQAKADGFAQDDSGSAVGVLASGSFRIYFGKAFLDLGYHYRNAAVELADSSVNGGYSGFVGALGLSF